MKTKALYKILLATSLASIDFVFEGKKGSRKWLKTSQHLNLDDVKANVWTV